MLAKSRCTVVAITGLGLLCSCAGLPGRRAEPVVDPCSVRSAPADTTGWIRMPLYFWVLMPPGFLPDTGRLGYWHGGWRWRDRRGRVLEVITEHWAEASFRPRPPIPPGAFAECHDVIDGRRVFLTAARRFGNFPSTPGRYSVTAWFPDLQSPLGGSAFFGSGPRRADQEFFLALFRTIKFARDTTGR